jgi:hypothetical protein
VKYLPKNTRAYFQAAPQYALHNLAEVPCSTLALATRKYRGDTKTKPSPLPDCEAVNFYALNHCAALVRKMFTMNEVLPSWAENVMTNYQIELVEQAERLTHYIICVIVREARHWHSPSISLSKAVATKFGQPVLDFLNLNRSSTETASVNNYMNNPPDTTLIKLVGGLAHIYDFGQWSGGYGGKAWGMIAKTLLSVLEGKTTIEMMVDTAYTLAHNNGPMFNKGMLYQNYNGKYFIMILDVQRSGQIPELMLEKGEVGFEYNPSVVNVIKEVKAAVPGAFGTYVDWFKVTALGAVGHYGPQQANQQKKHPKEVEFPKFLGQKAKNIGEWDVFPGQSVQVFERVKA